MAAVHVRSATADDHAAVARLVHELGVGDPVPTLERFVGEMIRTVLIAERDGQPVGYAFFRPMNDVVHLIHIVSAPEARREGVGRALMTEVVRRGREAQCTAMTLNVLATNTAAIRLYESFGFMPQHANVALEVSWSMIDELTDDEAPFAKDAREITPSDVAALETAWALPTGLLSDQRARPGRVSRMIGVGNDTVRPAFAVFDPAFPGTNPFRAPDLAHALSLLRAVRPFARPEHDFLRMLVENHVDLAEALVRAGATKKLETVFMRGAV